MKRFLTTLFSSPFMVYDNDGGAGDANNANVDGGDTGTATGQGGGGGDGDTGNKTSSSDTHEVTIDGEKRTLTTDELITLATKSGGADKRFQEAAAAKKEAERGIRIQTLVDTISEGEPTEADVKELSGLLKVDSEEFMAYMNEDSNADNSNNNSNANKNTDKQQTTSDFDKQFEQFMGMKPAEARAILTHSTNRHIEDARKEITNSCDLAVDKDAIIGKMIVGEDSDKVLSTVKDMVSKDVLRKIQNGEPFGAETITASVQMVRKQLTELGIPKKSNQQPIILGLGPGAGLPSEIQADEPIERVSSVDDKDESNLVQRYMQKAVQQLRKQR